MDGMRFVRAAWSYLSETYAAWSEHNAPRLGAALAYYTVFSIAPLLVIVIAIAGLVFGADAARGQVMTQIEALIGPESARALQDIVKNARSPTSGIVATIIGVVTLILGGSSSSFCLTRRSPEATDPPLRPRADAGLREPSPRARAAGTRRGEDQDEGPFGRRLTRGDLTATPPSSPPASPLAARAARGTS
jgi:hypothetical protein